MSELARRGGLAAALLALALCLASADPAAGPAGAGAGPAGGALPLSLDQALAEGLSRDPGIRSGSFDAISARAKALDALFRMLPSVTLSGGGMRSSSGSLASFGPIMQDIATFDGALVHGVPATSLGSTLAQMGTDMENFTKPSTEADYRVDLQYPVFAGFRLYQAAQLAKLGAVGKEAGLELARRAMAFEIQRAYWEATRATAGVATLSKALELEAVLRDEMKSMADVGLVTQADLLGEQARYDQAALSLDEAKSGQSLAFLGLASLVGDANAAAAPSASGYELLTTPGSRSWADPGSDSAALVSEALAARPETKLATVGLEVGIHAKALANGDLLPSLVVVGSYTHANPDFESGRPADAWGDSWNLGLRLRYDLGSLPGALAREKAASADLEKARADDERQRNAVALDVRRTLLALSKARNSLTLTQGMVAQAQENLRVTQAKFDNGLLKRSDLLQAQIALIRVQFAVTSKAIDIEIAQADLDRALARQNLP